MTDVTATRIDADEAARRRRREFTHAAPATMRLTGEQPDAWRDLLYAATAVSVISGIRAPHYHWPVFILMSFLVLAASYRSLLRVHVTARFFVLPLACFFCWHIYEAFRLSRHNGLFFVFQGLSVSIFVLAFANRYSHLSMRRFFVYSGAGYAALFAFVVGYHILHHRIVSYKFLTDGKAVFDMIPVMLVILKMSNLPSSRRTFWICAPIFVLFLFLSGERKAYILLILFSPLFVNFRSPATYILPLILLVCAPVAVSFDRTGYVARQLSTLQAFASGRVQQTGSNQVRASAIRVAWDLFKEHPADGIGTNGFQYEMAFRTGEGDAPHNEWMRVLAENGIVGFTFLAWTVLYGFVGLFRRTTWGRVRSRNEMIVAACLFATLVMYFSFEALKFTVTTAFVLTPFLQYLRLDPNETQAVWRRSRLASRRIRSPAPQVGVTAAA